MEADNPGTSHVAMEMQESAETTLPFVISSVQSASIDPLLDDGETTSLERPSFSGMLLPIAPPVGNDPELPQNEDSTVTPLGGIAAKPSRKVARKSTAKSAKNLPPKPRVEMNNNDLTKDNDLEMKTKDAARRLHEKLRLLSRFTPSPPQPENNKNSIKKSEESHIKIKLKVAKTDVEGREPEMCSTNAIHQEDTDVLPPSKKQKNFLQTSIIDFQPIPQDSSTPYNFERSEAKRKRGEDILRNSKLNSEEAEDVPKKKVLRSSSFVGSPDSSFETSTSQFGPCLTAFLYDSIDECIPCNAKFINWNSLKKHLRNGHQVRLVRETELNECELDILEDRNELNEFIRNVRPNACRHCGMKYKYLSCVIKHEKTCLTKKSRPMKDEVADASAQMNESIDGSDAVNTFSMSEGPSKEFDYVEPNQMPCEIQSQPLFKSRTAYLRKGFNADPDAVPPINQGFAKIFKSDGSFMWKCKMCEMKLSQKSNLKRHYGRHTEYFYKCQNCGLRMKHVKEYRTHKIYCNVRPSAPQRRAPVSQRVISTKVQKPFMKVGGMFARKVEQTNFGPREGVKKMNVGVKTQWKFPRKNEKANVGPKEGTKKMNVGGGARWIFPRKMEQTNVAPKEGMKKINIGGTTQWKCMICQKKVKYKSSMEKHYVCHFKGREQFFCQYCNHKSMDEQSNKQHETDCWNVTADGVEIPSPAEAQLSNGSYQCKICKRTFRNVYNYKLHSMKHSGLGIFKCDKCGRRHMSARVKSACCRAAANFSTLEGDGGDQIKERLQGNTEGGSVQEATALPVADLARKKQINDVSTIVTEKVKPGSSSTEDYPSPTAEKSVENGIEVGQNKAENSFKKACYTSTTKHGSVGQNKTETSLKKVDTSTAEDSLVEQNKAENSFDASTIKGGAAGLCKENKSIGKTGTLVTKDNSATVVEEMTEAPESTEDSKEGNLTKKRKSPMEGLTHGDVMTWARRLLAQTKKPTNKSKTFLNLKSHRCPICRRAFTSRSYLRTHLMYHARGPPEDCPYCGKSFIYHSYREKHIETCKDGSAAEDDDGDDGAVAMATDVNDDGHSRSSSHVEGHDAQEDAEVETQHDAEEIPSVDQVEVMKEKTSAIVKQCDDDDNDADDNLTETYEENDIMEVDEIVNDDDTDKNEESVNLEDEANNNIQADKDVKVKHCKVKSYTRGVKGKGYAKINIDDRWMFECGTCKRLFREHEVIIMHVKIHQKNSFHCNMCAKSFPTWMQFERHQIMSHGVRPIEEIDSGPESDNEVVISDSENDSDEDMYIDMEDDMKPPVVTEIEDVKPVLLQNIKRSTPVKREVILPTDEEDESDKDLPEDGDDGDQEELNEDYEQQQVYKAYTTQDKSLTKKTPDTKTKGKPKKRYECDFCHKLVASSNALYKHRLGHFGPSSYKCDTCNIGFVTPKDRNQHNLDFHGIPKPGGGSSKVAQVSGSSETVDPSKVQEGSDFMGKDSGVKSSQSGGVKDGHSDNHSSYSNAQFSRETSREQDVHSPTSTDSSEGSQSKRSKGYLCPGCHKVIKSESLLYSHMNLCIPDQPGCVYQCFKCGDHFIFRAAHIIHEYSCNGSKSTEETEQDYSIEENEPAVPKVALRKRSVSSANVDTPGSEHGVMSWTPSELDGSTYGTPKLRFDMPVEEKQLGGASDTSFNRTPKEFTSNAAYLKHARGVRPVCCLECNKELKAWSLHKHVNQCCPEKVTKVHTCESCGHSTKTYAGYMIHTQLGCDTRHTGLPRTSSKGSDDLSYLQDANREENLMSYQPRPIGSMEILNPNGQPIKVEIDYNFNEDAYASYDTESDFHLPPGGIQVHDDALTQEGSTEESRRYICEHCNKEYRSHSGLDYHKKKCTGHQIPQTGAAKDDNAPKGMSLKVNMPNQPTSGYRCQFCGDTFFHAALLHVHEASHSAKLQQSPASLGTLVPQGNAQHAQQSSVESESVEIMSCNICGKEFINKQRLQRHEKIHLNVKPFKCQLCSKGFGRRDNLRQHEFLVHKIKRNASDDDLDAESYQNMTNELMGQEDDEPFKRSEDTSTNYEKLETNNDRDNDVAENEMAVDYSMESGGGDGQEFEDSGNPVGYSDGNIDHDEDYESINDMNAFTVTQQYQCRLCPITCENLSAIKKHMATHSEDRPHKCDVCGLNFKQMGNLNRHKLTHEGVESAKNYVCPYCDKCYSQKLSLQSHILTHTGERPFQCRFCPKTFGREQVLKNHEKTHMEKKHECDLCFKKFARKDAMKVHRLHHLTDSQKPHHCDKCQRGFVTRQQLVDHKRSHTNERPYPCRHCGKSFTTAGGRGLHERLHVAKVVNFCCPTCKVIMHNYGTYKKHVAECQANGPDQL